MIPTAITIANQFSSILREWLSVEQLENINLENDGYRANDEPLCETHAYCDPNQAMLNACELLSPALYKGIFTKHVDLINKAWTLASDNHFEEIEEGK